MTYNLTSQTPFACNFSYSTLPVIFHIKHHLVVLKFTLDEKQCKVVDIPISYENNIVQM